MVIASIIFLVTGIVLLVIGYRKDNRKLMLIAAIILFLASGFEDYVLSFIEGFRSLSGR